MICVDVLDLLSLTSYPNTIVTYTMLSSQLTLPIKQSFFCFFNAQPRPVTQKLGLYAIPGHWAMSWRTLLTLTAEVSH